MVLGRPTDIYVDDYLPFYSWSSPKNFLYFAANGTDGGMWSAFLEKVWAKASGNYEIIEGGWSSESLRFLTGAPTVTYYKNYSWFNATQTWNIVTGADLSKYIMLAATPGSSDKNVISNGIAANHAYTLLNAYTVKYANGAEKAKLFLMRNPWGSDGNYNGSWSDNDAIWNDAVNNYKAQVPFVKNTKDGLFFITV